MIINIAGQKFGRLTVIGKNAGNSKHTMWDCVCDCGKKTTCRSGHLRSGLISSCGCLAIELQTKHGMARTSIYHAWQSMKDRCYNPNRPRFDDYGGRGIKVCDRWMEKFENFHSDMGDCPKGMTLDRIDNDKGYNKDNCQWASRMDQVLNRRNTHILTIGRKTLCLKHWCVEVCVPYNTARDRMKRGQSLEQALELL